MLLIVVTLTVFAQSPQMFNYQGVARDNGGNILANQSIGLQLDIRQTTANGTIVFAETHATSTSNFGLFNIKVGNGTPVTGVIAGIDWSNGPYFLEVSLDPAGGTNYLSMGVSQLLSVPYALYAENSGTPGPVGATGPTGPQGPTGTDGNDGANGATGATGPQGPTGANGSNGSNGATGATGPQGSTGADGNDGTAGATGPTGPTGADGTDGIDGATGATGPIGADGADGSDGAAGATGSTGPTGEDGTDGIDGATGATGPIGADGATGTTGPTGPTGADGNDGVAGTTGTTGPTGVQGPTGVTGATGPLVAGTSGQTLRHDGTDWLATSNLYNSGGNIGVGTTDPTAKVHVFNNQNRAMYLHSDTIGVQKMLEFTLTDSSSSDIIAKHGVYGYVYGGSPAYGAYYNVDGFSPSYGVYANVRGGTTYGFYANLDYTDGAANTARGFYSNVRKSGGSLFGPSTPKGGEFRGRNYGTYTNSAVFGVHAYAYKNTTGGVAYGIYSEVNGSANTEWAGYFNGASIFVNGTAYTSDRKLKQHIRPAENSLERILDIKVKTYDYRKEEFPHMNLPEGNRTGLIAQDLETVIPELVVETQHPAADSTAVKDGEMSDGPEVSYKAIDYVGLIPYMIEAMQEQQAIIQDQQRQIDELRKLMKD